MYESGKILIELPDEELKLLSIKEYRKLINSDEKYDGFNNWSLIGFVTFIHHEDLDKLIKGGEVNITCKREAVK